MCAKPPKPKKVEEKPVQYLRNPFLDGLSVGAEPGRNSLRIDLGSNRTPRPFEGNSPGQPTKPSARSVLPVMPGLLIPQRTARGGIYASR